MTYDGVMARDEVKEAIETRDTVVLRLNVDELELGLCVWYLFPKKHLVVQ